VARKGYVRKRPLTAWDLLSFEEHSFVHEFIAQRPDGATLDEIGAAMGVTGERVRQIYERALSKLRDHFGVHGLDETYQEERREPLPSLEDLSALELTWECEINAFAA
jgi:hypothetical protein